MMFAVSFDFYFYFWSNLYSVSYWKILTVDVAYCVFWQGRPEFCLTSYRVGTDHQQHWILSCHNHWKRPQTDAGCADMYTISTFVNLLPYWFVGPMKWYVFFFMIHATCNLIQFHWDLKDCETFLLWAWAGTKRFIIFSKTFRLWLWVNDFCRTGRVAAWWCIVDIEYSRVLGLWHHWHLERFEWSTHLFSLPWEFIALVISP